MWKKTYIVGTFFFLKWNTSVGTCNLKAVLKLILICKLRMLGDFGKTVLICKLRMLGDFGKTEVEPLDWLLAAKDEGWRQGERCGGVRAIACVWCVLAFGTLGNGESSSPSPTRETTHAQLRLLVRFHLYYWPFDGKGSR